MSGEPLGASRQHLFDLEQQPGEVEPVGAGGAGSFEVGAGPVAGFRWEGLVELAGQSAASRLSSIPMSWEGVLGECFVIRKICLRTAGSWANHFLNAPSESSVELVFQG